MGLREENKQRTRARIVEAATELFAEHGYEAVTVPQIAAAARVSPATVFNYVRSKEELFFPALEAFGQDLARAVAQRPAGTPVLAAAEEFLIRSDGLLPQVSAGDPEAVRRLRTISRLIADSPALQARERRVVQEYRTALADAVRSSTNTGTASTGTVGTGTVGTGAASTDSTDTDTGGLQAQVVASAVVGVHQALVMLVRRRVLADERLDELAEDVQVATRAAFRLLADGLADVGG